jgi:deazaflavin-dependent oxidoreductase (nitroreductase family)
MNTDSQLPVFREPSRVERIFNRAFGFLVGLGLGLPHNYLLQVRGRRTGRIYSTPVNLLVVELSWSGGKRYLVAPRGRTQWVRNVEAAGEITLKKGRTRQNFRVRPVPDSEKPEFLKMYLERFAPTVQRYFPIPAGSPVEAFHDLARNYPVFELLPS